MVPYDINFENYTDEQINTAFDQTIEEFKKIESLDFNRMQKQIEIARFCIKSFKEGKEQVILSAPTGFGKSILAFFVTEVVKNLTTKYNDATISSSNRSYLLTSNIFLQEQYDKDIKLFGLSHAMLKGQSNYFCNVTKTDIFPKAPCNDESVSSLMASGAKGKFPCFTDCIYLNTRKRAIAAPSTVFNYSYFLTTMNHVYNKLPAFAPFQPRLLTIFDECHILRSVVDDMFTTEFNINKFIRRVFAMSSVIRNHDSNDEFYNMYGFTSEVFMQIVKLYSEISKHQNDHTIFKDNLSELVLRLSEIYNIFERYISPKIDVDTEAGEKLNDYQKELKEFLLYLAKTYVDIHEMCKVYEEIGYETAVIQFIENDLTKIKVIESLGDITNYSMKLQCTQEAWLIQKAAIKFTKYSILMSATIGNPYDYGMKIGCTNFAAYDIESDFDFTKSPIYLVQPLISMNYSNKAKNMPSMMQRISRIIEENPGVRGLIHTGNYEIMREIQKLRNPRILTYSNSAEKSEILRLLSSKPDAVIAGPSLIEGIDLKDDLCRFMIYAKVPFLSLGDKLNKRRMEIYKGWYDFETMVSFQQGLGRPNRHKTDWCKTYLLDESFKGFFNRYKMPPIINNRIVETHIDSLGEVIVDKSEEEFEALLNSMQK